jgi:CHAD domain-containing protein
MTTITAFQLVALSCLGHLQNNEKGVHESATPEFIHQARVAIRRLRSAIRLWKRQLPTAFVVLFDPHWRTLTRQLGDTRNWDVFVSETLPPLTEAFPEHHAAQRLSNYAVRHAAKSRKTARTLLKSTDYSKLLLKFTAELLAIPELTDSQHLNTFARRCLNKRLKRVLKLTNIAHDAETRHRLRVALKRLRYALEFFTPLFPDASLNAYHQAVNHLQDLLGQMNDLVVAEQLASEALTGKKADFVRHWLAGRSEALLSDVDLALNRFIKKNAPWKQ